MKDTDGQVYWRCTECGEYVNETEWEAHKEALKR